MLKTLVGHLNPAVSFAYLLDGSITFNEFCVYVLGQVTREIVGAAATYAIYFDYFKVQEGWTNVL